MNAEHSVTLKEVFLEAVTACSPRTLLPPLIESSRDCIRIAGHSLGNNPLHVFGSGKAAVSMANSLYTALGKRIAGGTLVSPEESPTLPPNLRHFTGDHPIPTERSYRAGQVMMQAMKSLLPSDRFVYLLSGESSALMEIPAPPFSISDIAIATKLLFEAGLPIADTNMVRIHLSRLKGGGLSKQIRAKGIVLVMSDVLDSPLSVIGSAPLWAVKRNYNACVDLLRNNGLWPALPANIRSFLTKSPEEEPLSFAIPHEIVADNRTMLYAVRAALEDRKVPVRIVSDHLDGEAADVGHGIAGLALNVSESLKDGEKLALLFSGETTVTVKGNGTGGRCQELALAALAELQGNPAITLFTAGSDGRDGPTDAAGAVADHRIWIKSQEIGLFSEKFLAQNDSYHFFQSTGGLINTGPTGINLLDIVIALIQR